ncbi:hypothetical protein ACVJGC_005484 [Bradyrhizobium diazoefficiens]
MTRRRKTLSKREWERVRAEQAELAKARKTIDRANAIVDGLIQPPWMMKPKPVSQLKIKSSSSKQRTGRQMPRLLPLLHELYPPNGIPPGRTKTVAIVQRVQNEFEKRGWGTIGRDTIEHAIGRGRYRGRPALR